MHKQKSDVFLPVDLNPLHNRGTAGRQTLFDNFTVHVVGLNGSNIGIIQSLGETPGFLYILDHNFLNFAIAIKTFFQKISKPTDITPSMTAWFAINHIAAVIIPALRGLIWLINYRISFAGGALFSLLSSIAVIVHSQTTTEETITVLSQSNTWQTIAIKTVCFTIFQ